MGAYSSIAGLSLTAAPLPNEGVGDWEMLAIGDSCIFHVRGERLLQSYPLTHSQEFNNRPVLLSSLAHQNANIPLSDIAGQGKYQPDDRFYLMTDALACWFLTEYEAGRTPWQILRDLGTSDSAETFPDLVLQLRTSKVLKNDDVTLVRVDVV
jgi:hypothetical protein